MKCSYKSIIIFLICFSFFSSPLKSGKHGSLIDVMNIALRKNASVPLRMNFSSSRPLSKSTLLHEKSPQANKFLLVSHNDRGSKKFFSTESRDKNNPPHNQIHSVHSSSQTKAYPLTEEQKEAVKKLDVKGILAWWEDHSSKFYFGLYFQEEASPLIYYFSLKYENNEISEDEFRKILVQLLCYNQKPRFSFWERVKMFWRGF